MKNTVSVLIPTYNESTNIIPLVERIHTAISEYDYDILFIDDDSRDGTADIARSLAAQYPVSVMVRKDKKGLASAVVDGLAQARGETVVVMDADLQHPPEVISGLLEAMDGGADMAVGSRYVPGGGCQGWSLVRRIISKGAIFLSHLFLPTTRHTKDPMSGYFAFRKSAVAGLALEPKGYKILLEILVLGNFRHTAEVPYVFKTRSRGESKLNSRQQVEYLKHLYSLMRRTGEHLRFVKFLLVGGSGIIVNEGLLWLLKETGGLPLAAASPISIEASIISNFILNNFFTFGDRRIKAFKPTLLRLIKFNVVALGGLVINWGILLLFTEIFGIHYLISNLCGIAIAFLWNYLANHWWTWR